MKLKTVGFLIAGAALATAVCAGATGHPCMMTVASLVLVASLIVAIVADLYWL